MMSWKRVSRKIGLQSCSCSLSLLLSIQKRSIYQDGVIDKIGDRCNVAIFGGGIMGTSLAYCLKDKLPIDFKVTVIERDPYYLRASTTLSVGGIRQQFSLKENIQMSMYTANFLKEIKKHLSILDNEPPDIRFHQLGYLTLAGSSDDDNEQVEKLMQNYRIQKEHGASVEWLTNEQIQSKFPMINVDGIKGAVFGTKNEGWFDPYLLLMAIKNKAMFLGAKYHCASVIDFFTNENYSEDNANKKCNKVLVQKPDKTIESIEFDIGIVCSGYDSKRLAQSLGYGSNKVKDFRRDVDFPVEPRKRYVFVFNCKDKCHDWKFPFLVDKSGIYCRMEGNHGNFICGRSPKTLAEEPEIDNLDVDYSYFDQYIHPTLAERVPSFEAIKIRAAWAGFYDYNRLDQNPIIGQDPFFKNIYWATGFSGHGIQMGPALGRAMMELIIHGQYETIDLTRFGWQRILDNKPILEQNIY